MDRPTYLVHVDATRQFPDRVRVAARLAVRHDAHLVGVASGIFPAPAGMNCIGEAAEAVLMEYHAMARERVAHAMESFFRLARQAGAELLEARTVDDDMAHALCVQACYSDLVVVSQADLSEPGSVRGELAAFVALNAGRPVLVCPAAGDVPIPGRRCLVAWDGSVEAARAITGALPILRRAEKTVVSVFDPERSGAGHGPEPGADMGLYLARHGVDVEVVRGATGRSIDVGEALLSQAADLGGDLLVMGAYGHARLREVVLGGVTETCLREMTLPLLLAH